jgi:uncharacterized protein (TIGR03067 family)
MQPYGKRRYMRESVPTIILATLLLTGCGSRGDGDVKRGLDGTWEMTAVEWDGTTRDPGQYLELFIDGDRWAWKYTNPTSTVGGKCWIDPTTIPASIDLITTDGPGAGDVSEAIYALDGDTLKLALGMKNGARSARPQGFGGAGITVLVFKREGRRGG